MKNIFLTALLLVSFTSIGFSQNSTFKDIENSFKNKNYVDAYKHIMAYDSLLKNSDITEFEPKQIVEYNYFKLKTFDRIINTKSVLLSKIDNNPIEKYAEVVKFFTNEDDIVLNNPKTPKPYTFTARRANPTRFYQAKDFIENSAKRNQKEGIEDYSNQKFDESKKKLFLSYEYSKILGKVDTLMLYYAFNSAYADSDYEMTTRLGEKLIDYKYKDSKRIFRAFRTDNGEPDVFATKKEMDKALEEYSHENGEITTTESKLPKIYKYTALAYKNLEDYKNQMKVLDKAYYEVNDPIIAKEYMSSLAKLPNIEEAQLDKVEDIVLKNDRNPGIWYAYAKIYEKKGDHTRIMKGYRQALFYALPESDEKFNINIGAFSYLLGRDSEFTERLTLEANKENATQEDIDLISSERIQNLKNAIKYLEEAHNYQSDNTDISNALIQVYKMTGQDEKAEDLKTEIAE